MDSHFECEECDVKHEDDPLSVAEIKTESLNMKYEIKIEAEDCVEFSNAEKDSADVKDEILAHLQFDSTMKTESKVVDTSDFFHIVLEVNEIKHKNTEVDENNSRTEDPECLAKNYVANTDTDYACNAPREEVHTCSLTNTPDFQDIEGINLKPEAGGKSKVETGKYTHTDQNLFKCNICNREFNLKSSLFKHLHSHNSEKPFSCGICRKSFSLQSLLTRHLKIHEPVMPYTCNVCNKTFTKKSVLTRHLCVDSGEKRIMFDVCNNSFSCKRNVDNHLHDGEKPFSCDICGKSFSRNSYLAEHLQIHIGEKFFSCNICGKSFVKKFSLSRHMHIHNIQTQKTF